MFSYALGELYTTEATMNRRLALSLVIPLLGLVLFTGCQRINEPWDTTGYFEKERTRTPEQQKALQHRLASIQDTSADLPWLHAQH